jgi:glycerol-1-phosphate dehydrogenase [NAD(P)+]
MTPRMTEALRAARDTRDLLLGAGVLASAGDVFAAQFGEAPAVVVGDMNTMRVAGKQVAAAIPRCTTFVFDDPDLYAQWDFVKQLEAAMKRAPADAIPVAVGSGTINDLAKLVAHRLGRPYMCVATAASMDGYTAYGSSITKDGEKQTFDCPAPRAVVADMDVIAAAPPEMTAAGYADLLAKLPAGADWIIADALGVEPIDATAWGIVQGELRTALADPAACAAGVPSAIGKLTEGLVMGGFAMQAAQSSRCASGAEHQFSHLWDMEHHTHQGKAPSHGFKVGVATVAVTRLYERLMGTPMQDLDVDAACQDWPTKERLEESVTALFPDPAVLKVALRESLAKHVTVDALADQLRRLKEVWPRLVVRLGKQLPPSAELADNLRAVGAPVDPEEIGISRERLHLSFYKAYFIRRRFTVLDLAVRTGTLGPILDDQF